MKLLKNLLIKLFKIEPEYKWHFPVEKNRAYYEAIGALKKNEFFVNMINEMRVAFTIECSKARDINELIKYQALKQSMDLIKYKISEAVNWIEKENEEVKRKKQLEKFKSSNGAFAFEPIMQDPFIFNLN